MKVKAILICGIVLGMGFGLGAVGEDWQWLYDMGGLSQDYGQALATDASGNSYITGGFGEASVVGTELLITHGSTDIFIAKISSSGTWYWAVRAGGTGYDIGAGITVDAAGNVYVTGFFEGLADFGATDLNSLGGYDIFACKLDTNGNWLWAQNTGTGNSDFGYGIALDGSGDVFVSGQFNERFIAAFKLNNSGTLLTANQMTGTGTGAGQGIAVDYYGSVYLTGYLDGSANFGSTPLTSFGGKDIIVAKLNNDLGWGWVRQAGGFNDDRGMGIAVDETGSVYPTGFFSGQAIFGPQALTASGIDAFVAKLDSAGMLTWVRQAGGAGVEAGMAITVDEDKVYLGGVFSASCVIANTILESNGGSDVFVSTLSRDGDWLWAKGAGGPNADMLYAVAADASGAIVITGCYEDSITFGNLIQMTFSGCIDAFLIRIGWSAPKAPQNVGINIMGSQVLVYWDPVIRSVYEQNLTPDYYFVYKSTGDIYGPWVLYQPTPETYIHHDYVGLVVDRIFYRVTAVKLYARSAPDGGDRAAWLKANLKEGMSEAEVTEALERMEGVQSPQPGHLPDREEQ